MAITKIQSESLNLADTYDFTGTVTGAGGNNKPAFSAYFTSSQSFSTDTWTKINFAGELFDTDNCFDSSTNMRFTPTTAGKYLLTSRLNFDGASGGVAVLCQIRKNGNQINDGYDANNPSTASNTAVSATFSTIIDANGSSDYFEVYGYHTHGSDRSVFNGSFYGAKIIT